MFDEALRLAAWNRNFQQVLDLPEEFLAERHGFDGFVRYLTERGEFGESDSPSPTAVSITAPPPPTSRLANLKPPTTAPTTPFNRSSISLQPDAL
jgi:hypothetical protein